MIIKQKIKYSRTKMSQMQQDFKSSGVCLQQLRIQAKQSWHRQNQFHISFKQCGNINLFGNHYIGALIYGFVNWVLAIIVVVLFSIALYLKFKK